MISKVISCDLCGEELDCFSNTMITHKTARIQVWGVGVSRTTQGQRIDLCPECYEKFINWFDNQTR